MEEIFVCPSSSSEGTLGQIHYSMPATDKQWPEGVTIRPNTVDLSSLGRCLDFRAFSYLPSNRFIAIHIIIN